MIHSHFNTYLEKSYTVYPILVASLENYRITVWSSQAHPRIKSIHFRPLDVIHLYCMFEITCQFIL